MLCAIFSCICYIASLQWSVAITVIDCLEEPFVSDFVLQCLSCITVFGIVVRIRDDFQWNVDIRMANCSDYVLCTVLYLG